MDGALRLLEMDAAGEAIPDQERLVGRNGASSSGF
jgi:hypothetical protein